MALDFPNNPPPVSGQTYLGENGITYVFDGVKWIGQAALGVQLDFSRLTNGQYVVQLDATGNLVIPVNGDVVRNGVSAFDYNHESIGIATVGNVAPDTGEGTFWYHTDEGRLYVKEMNVWTDANPPVPENPSYITGIMEDFAGNIVPAANVTYSLGTQQAQWKDLWVSNNTIYIGNTPITVSNGTLLVNGNVISGGGDRLVNGSLELVLDRSGTLQTPLLLPVTFTAVLDSEHMIDAVGFTDEPWEFEVQFQVGPNGEVVSYIGNNTPFFVNPGYVDGYEFEYTETDHGIPGYTFTITLNDVVQAGPAGWTTNPAVGQPPEYPSTIESLGAIKLTSNSNSWTFGTSGSTRFPTGLSIESLAPYYEGAPVTGTVIQQTANTDLNLYSIGANARTVIGWLENTLNSEFGGNVAEIQFNNYVGEARIVTGEYGNQVNGWQFRADGNLVLPPNSYVLNSDDSIYSGGGAANTGNVQFDGNILYVEDGNQFYTGFLNLQNNENEVVLGSDTASTIRIGVYEDGNFNEWTFDSNGSLTFPNGNITIASNIGGSGTDAMLGSANAAVGIIAQGESGSVGLQWNDTGVDVELGSNIAGVVVNSPAGSTPGTVQIVTGVIGSQNTWEFGANGVTTFPNGLNFGFMGEVYMTGGTAAFGSAEYDTNIVANASGIAQQFNFGANGTLTLPGKLWARASDSGSIAFTNNGVDERGYLKVDAGYNMIVNTENNFYVKRAGTDRLAITDTTSDFKAVTDVRFVSNLAGSNKTWEFAASGIATLPSNSYLETTDANLKIGSQGTVTIRANAATVESTRSWTFGTNGVTTFPGNILVPGNLSNIAGFAFYNGDPISIVATATIWALSFAEPYYIEIAKTGLPAGFDTLLGSGAWTATANGLTLTVVSVVSNGDYWRITVAQNPNGTITTIATFNRAASGANIVVPSSGSINFANGVNILSTVGTYSNTNVTAYLAGNVTVGNLLLASGGEITTAAGTGNVVIEANDGVSRTWTFGSNAALIFPDTTAQSTAYQRTTGSWTVANGAPATYSFTVPGNATYTMWVKCNIPNGIIIWNATVSVTNTNVPAIGTQYAWNYTDGGSPILLVTIPDQIRGTAGAISTDNTYAGITSNRFDFGISNTSGETQTVYWGYVVQ